MTKDRFENSWHNVRGVSEEELRGDPEVIRKYGDILNTKWDGVRNHLKAKPDVRAAQFSPFAALTGYDDEIRETARLTESQRDLAEDVREELDIKMCEIQARFSEHPEISVTHFVPDQNKKGGAYVTLEGTVHKIDVIEGVLVMTGGKTIDIDSISEIVIKD
ncbi:hypothetical protein SAMN06296386_10836 [Lachnospiraceae bacterium]|nr:hypothetical protein SAMN06296386_10836 [Lachnospiraceae bacterium]